MTKGLLFGRIVSPTPIPYYQNPNGWKYKNTNAGNAMNLYYFNGADEIKTLAQVTGQYAVITNISTKVNNKMVFAIFTKSSTSFFTTRVTRSRKFTSSFMSAGGKYLLYWGDVPDDLYPSLPRINFPNYCYYRSRNSNRRNIECIYSILIVEQLLAILTSLLNL
jgi:hypothetical protein